MRNDDERDESWNVSDVFALPSEHLVVSSDQSGSHELSVERQSVSQDAEKDKKKSNSLRK